MNILKSLTYLLKNVQKKVDRRLYTNENDQNVLKQNTFIVKSLTWGLIASSGITITWFTFAFTEEIVIARGTLEPIGDVKNIQIPGGGVVKEILVTAGEKVSEGQILLVLDNKISQENLNSFQEQIKQKFVELNLKKQEKIKSSEIFQKRSETLSEELKLEKDISQRLKYLFEEGGVAEFRYLEKLQNVRNLEGQIIENEINLQRQSLILDQDLKSLEGEISALQAKNTEAQVLLGYKFLKSPVKGIVSDLKPTNVGFLAQANIPIMKIIPLNDLEADIKIPSSKIGFVKVGMPVDISIDSYPSTDFATLKGNIKYVGYDALDKSNSQGQFFFPARVKLETQSLFLKNKKSLPLQVGMSLKANIKLRKVSYLNLLLGTFRNKTESLKSI